MNGHVDQPQIEHRDVPVNWLALFRLGERYRPQFHSALVGLLPMETTGTLQAALGPHGGDARLQQPNVAPLEPSRV